MKMERGLTDLGIVFEAAPPEGVVSLADLGSAFLGVPTPSPAAQSKFNRIADAIAGGMRNFFATPGDFAAGRHAVAPANAGQITEEEAFRLNQAQDAMTNWGAQAALAMLGVGAPKAMIGAGGAAGGRLPGPRSLPMDEASRMARSREMGHAPEPFYRGERNGLLPRQYESAHFSRSKSVADGYARVGGHPEAREFRLDLRNAYKDYEPLTAKDFARLVAAAAKTEPKFAADLVDLIIPGGDVGKFLHFARKSPNFKVTKPNGTARLRVAIENSSKNPSGLFRRAGFDAIDAGRDVRKLTGYGIRLKDAVFDPAKANSKDIMASLAALGTPSLLAVAQDGE